MTGPGQVLLIRDGWREVGFRVPTKARLTRIEKFASPATARSTATGICSPSTRCSRRASVANRLQITDRLSSHPSPHPTNFPFSTAG